MCGEELSLPGRAGPAGSDDRFRPLTVKVVDIALFTAAGFPEPGRAIETVLSYVMGISTTEAAWLSTVARSGESEAGFIARLMPAAQQAAAGHAHLVASYAEAETAAFDPAALRDEKFTYGLEVVLDRPALRLAR